ncbi:MAG: hypothetical protein RIS47_1426, partial [Bacteroidota bacterium]
NETLAPNDSLYVFVELTIDPNGTDTPVLVRDSVTFELNGNLQHVKLMAYGQDVHLVNQQILKTAVWKADKPYLIRNSMLVDTLETLTLLSGTKLYFESGSRLYVKGSLVAQGTKTQPVVFTGARTEKMYDDIPGLWDGIWLLPGSVNNRFEYAEIKNAIVGIRADSLIQSGKPCLSLNNSRIEHHTAIGILAQGSSIVATNTIVGDCGIYAVSLQVGGDYKFYQCTLANYWYYSTRSTPSLSIRNYYTDTKGQTQLRPITNALFANCIVYGTLENEIELDGAEGATFNYLFDHCLLRISPKIDLAKYAGFVDNITNQNPIFVNPSLYDYHLKTTSPIRGRASTPYIQAITDLATDFDGVKRPDIGDIGAYMYVESVSK